LNFKELAYDGINKLRVTVFIRGEADSAMIGRVKRLFLQTS
jgi:hypothetical protein